MIWFVFFACRRFPTVEKRSRLTDGDDHVPVPNNQEFVTNLCTELGLKGKAGKVCAVWPALWSYLIDM